VVHALRSLGGVCSEIRFVTTSRLPAAEREKLQPHVQVILEVDNVGFDFSMWKRCIAQDDLAAYDEVVLMNSSVYGPIGDISATFAAMQEEPCDAWGMVESLEHDRHLQSFFFVFRRPVLSSGAFRAFWDSVLPYRNKRQVIRSYEIGLTQWLVDAGFAVAAFCPWRQVVRYVAGHPRRPIPIPRDLRGIPRLAARGMGSLLRHLHRVYVHTMNPTVAYPGELLELGVPFLKLEVMRDNPFDRDLDAIRRQLQSLGYPAEYVLPERPGGTKDGMRTTPAEACPLCGQAGVVLHAGRSDVYRTGTPPCWNVRRCRGPACGCAWLDPMPLESEIHRAYASYYTHPEVARRVAYFAPAYGQVNRILLGILRTALGLLGTHARREAFWPHGLTKGGGRLLEVGCGSGSRLLDLQKRGWIVEGQDVDARAVSHARSRGLQVHLGNLQEAPLQEGGYDVILMSHVLEHLHRPVELLRHCRKLLRPGGKLVLSTPNIESLGHAVYGRNWMSLDPPRHLIIHSRRSLGNLLREAGFSEVSIRSEAVNCEITTMHSRDIKYLGWTDADSVPRLNRELVPVAMQVAAILLHRVAPGSGEEWLAVATRDG
jgi:2-polyprenyl-3-methyl-5-hydroxy-6-metoxy-1,4-benzoquinol methylase